MWSTQLAVDEPSVARLADTPSTDRALVYLSVSSVVPAASFSVTVSPLLPRLSVPVDEATALVRPAGMAELPPKTAIACPAASEPLKV